MTSTFFISTFFSSGLKAFLKGFFSSGLGIGLTSSYLESIIFDRGEPLRCKDLLIPIFCYNSCLVGGGFGLALVFAQ